MSNTLNTRRRRIIPRDGSLGREGSRTVLLTTGAQTRAELGRLLKSAIADGAAWEALEGDLFVAKAREVLRRRPGVGGRAAALRMLAVYEQVF